MPGPLLLRFLLPGMLAPGYLSLGRPESKRLLLEYLERSGPLASVFLASVFLLPAHPKRSGSLLPVFLLLGRLLPARPRQGRFPQLPQQLQCSRPRSRIPASFRRRHQHQYPHRYSCQYLRVVGGWWNQTRR